MGRPSRRVTAVAVALIVTSAGVLGIAAMYGQRQMNSGTDGAARGPDVREARRSTGKVRADLRAIMRQIRRANWPAADSRLRTMRSDWEALVRATHLTNRHFVDDMDALQEAIRHHNRKAAIATVRLMDRLIRLLEAVFS